LAFAKTQKTREKRQKLSNDTPEAALIPVGAFFLG